MSELLERGIFEHAEALCRREYSARELALAYLDRINKIDSDIGAYITLCADAALVAADRVDGMRLSGGELSALAGIPFALKDNICSAGVRTTCASRILENYTPP